MNLKQDNQQKLKFNKPWIILFLLTIYSVKVNGKCKEGDTLTRCSMVLDINSDYFLTKYINYGKYPDTMFFQRIFISSVKNEVLYKDAELKEEYANSLPLIKQFYNSFPQINKIKIELGYDHNINKIASKVESIAFKSDTIEVWISNLDDSLTRVINPLKSEKITFGLYINQYPIYFEPQNFESLIKNILNLEGKNIMFDAGFDCKYFNELKYNEIRKVNLPFSLYYNADTSSFFTEIETMNLILEKAAIKICGEGCGFEINCFD